MKSRFLLFAAAVLMLASCTMQQRVHQPGWYFQFNGLSNNHKKVEQPAVQVAQISSEESIPATNESVAVTESAPIVQQEVSLHPTAALTSTEQPLAKKHRVSAPALQNYQIVTEVPVEKTSFRQQALTQLYKATSGSSTNEILLIILAIILPPLGVYLFEGASKMFWITLILCLLGGGYAVAPFFVSFWFIAALLAVLRILGMI